VVAGGVVFLLFGRLRTAFAGGVLGTSLPVHAVGWGEGLVSGELLL
jgi:hypothetical protein